MDTVQPPVAPKPKQNWFNRHKGRAGIVLAVLLLLFFLTLLGHGSSNTHTTLGAQTAKETPVASQPPSPTPTLSPTATPTPTPTSAPIKAKIIYIAPTATPMYIPPTAPPPLPTDTPTQTQQGSQQQQ